MTGEPQPVSLPPEPLAAIPALSPSPAAAASRQHPRLDPQAHARGHVHLIFPSLLDTARSLLVIVSVALFILTFIVQPFRIPSESMERTLLVGDFLLVNKTIFAPAGHWKWLLPYRQPRRGDIVVFHFPLNPPEHVVKRVIALPGDRVHLRDAVVFVDGVRQDEPYALYLPASDGAAADAFRDQFPSALYADPGIDTRWWIRMRRIVRDGELPVPPASYFVLGDNRNYSRDSRYWGFVPRADIVGRPFVIYFSLREPSPSGVSPLPSDRLQRSPFNSILGFARWDRMFQLVR